LSSVSRTVAPILVPCILCLATSLRAQDAAPATRPATPAVPVVKEPYPDPYAGKLPPFLTIMQQGMGYGHEYNGWERTEEEMKLSSEPKFFTLNILDEDSRAYALVEAGRKKEAQGEFREALKIYQQVIDKYPNVLYRTSRYGVFVPITQYCQRRILGFPPTDLAHYRTQYDARAAEAFEQARRQYSLLGLSDIVDGMLATSYGGKAIVELGNAALDAGHYLAALEYFSSVQDFFPDKNLRTPELELKIAQCRKMLGEPEPKSVAAAGSSGLTAEQLARLRQVIAASAYEKPPFFTQRASEPNVAPDDYALMPPTTDPLGLADPVWQFTLPGSRRDLFVFSQPVVTDNSAIYRHKNILYCRSILNGSLRWTNDLGGRAVWQNTNERQYPQEDVLVQDGMVFTPISKAGPSLVALDEVTGQVKWAYGPMVAATVEESRMRFEAAPAGGPRTIYAGYVLDNIEGDTHIDSEYGLIAFDSTSGRIHWRQPLCRLAPGKFSAGFAEQRRNRIRSFTSPPLYHQGTVYYNTNAGVVAAMDAMSGRIKWLMRYPYYPGVHDATRQFGRGGELVQYSRVYFTPHDPMFWYNQRPMLDGERLFVLPVDTNTMLCVDRRSGKVNWSRAKAGPGCAYLLGLTADRKLAMAYTGRDMDVPSHHSTSPVQLLDPATGQTVWSSGDIVVHEDQPVMKNYFFGSWAAHYRSNEAWFELAARPLLTADGRLYHTSFRYVGYPIFGYFANLACVDLNTHKTVAQRRFYSGEILARADTDIHKYGPEELAGYEEMPHKDADVQNRIRLLKEIVADTVPENDHGPFLPFSRVTFSRYGVPFELRMSPRTVEMVYDRDAVRKAIERGSGPANDFARAELTVADGRLDEASGLLTKCLDTISSEDLDFRAAINQQLYRVHKQLARRAIRSGRLADELDNCLGMSRTASTLAEETETLFAVAEALQRQGKLDDAAIALRTIISTYGHHEYPISPVAMADKQKVLDAAAGVLSRYQDFVKDSIYAPEMTRSLELMAKGLPLYLSTVSPLPKTITVRAGELVAARLIALQQQSGEFAQRFQATAKAELAGKTPEEQTQRLWEFAGTPAAQETLEALFARAAALDPAEGRRQRWRLADAARVSGLRVPDAFRARVSAPPAGAAEPGIALPQTPQPFKWADAEGAERLVLERRGDRSIRPELLFIGARVRKRLDNKFTLTAMDAATGQTAWQTPELRLKGRGQEPGFFEAFVYEKLVLVHGLYDVLAFQVADGKLAWRYEVPFDFEIRSALLSGDLLILAGSTETLALYVATDSEVGEVAWQVKEMGDLYIEPYMHGDRLISVRKLPYSVTVRYRATGRLIGRLDLPDLSQFEEHPLLENGPPEVPSAHDRELLVLSDGWYYIMIDVDRLQIVWKRLIDANDVTREPPLRFALGGDYFAVLKDDYDQDAIYMLSSRTGEVLWHSDPKEGSSPRPMHSMVIVGETVYGIEPHAGQGFYFVGRDCRSGRRRFREEVVGYQAKPEVLLLGSLYGDQAVVRVSDRQDFELRAFDVKTGKPSYTLKMTGVAPFGVHGRMSATVQNGRLVMLSKDELSF
jgi:outer membrane protein assembly factor BamB